MLTISFPGHPEARAIIIQKPVNEVSGIVECSICDWHMALMVSSTEEMTTEIERFIKDHECLPLAREKEVIAFAERLKKGAPPTMVIKVEKVMLPRAKGVNDDRT